MLSCYDCVFYSKYRDEFIFLVHDMNSSKLTIGQITDLHARHAIHGSSAVPQRRSRDAFALLPQAIDLLKDHGVDFLVLTGDLVDVPTFILQPNDYYQIDMDAWLPLVEADYRLLKEILDGCDLPYMVLPGNHDYEPILWQVFDRSMNVVDVEQGYRLVRFCDREWQGHVPRRFDRERKLWMQMLADEQSPPQIHLQHYVITPDLNEEYPHTYFEGHHLREQMAASGQVILSLSGHYHSGTDLINADGCHFTVCPAFGEFPHPLRVYTVDGNQVSMQQFCLAEQPYRAGRKVVFLDRDGVINTLASYNTGPEAMALIPGASQAILRLRQAGYAVVVITNQSSIGFGHVSPAIVDTVHERMCQLLVEEAGDRDAQPDAIFFSSGAGDKAVHPTLADLSLTKPSPALLQQAATLLGLDPTDAWMVGDRVSDLQAALAYGATPILVRTGDGTRTETVLSEQGLKEVVVCENIDIAVNYIKVYPD